MNVQVENQEHSMAKLTVEVSKEVFENAVQKSYLKNKKNITIPGFRKGKAPRFAIEQMYGKGVFYDDAAQFTVNETFSEAIEESKVEVVTIAGILNESFNDDGNFVYELSVAVKPEVTLGEYKNLPYEETAVEVTDEEVENELKAVQEKQSSIETVDEPAESGYTVNINYDGSVDGVHFDGGKSENYDLVLGSNTFIPGFEDQLIGHSAGDELDVNVTFPEEYHSADLAGKAAVFAVKVNEVKKKNLPEIDDEFAAEVSDFETLDEYKEDIRKKALERKEKEAKARKEAELVKKAVENATLEVADIQVASAAENEVNNQLRMYEAQGFSRDLFLQYTNQKFEDLVESQKPMVLERIREELVLSKIAEVEEINVSDEDVEKEYSDLADQYKGQLTLEQIKTRIPKDNIVENLKLRKAARLVAGTQDAE